MNGLYAIGVGLLFWSGLQAAEVTTTAVATVNGEAISLRELEDELLKVEGTEYLLDLVALQLEQQEWSTLADEDIIVGMAGWKLPRVALAAGLLKRKGGEVREELINLALVRQALERAGLHIDQDLINHELHTMERRFQERLESEGKPIIPFADFIRESQGMPLEEWIEQPGFRVLTGIHALLYAHYTIPDDDLRSFMQRHYRRYAEAEARDISVIYSPFRTDPQQAPLQNEIKSRIDLIRNFYEAILRGRMSWEKVYRMLGGPDPDYGRKGWVDRSGRAEALGESDVPPQVVDAIFRVRPTADSEPVLLDPIISDHGVSLIRVHAHRPARKPTFSVLKSRLQRDYIDEDLDHWTKRFMDELRRDAQIDYTGMSELAAERQKQARALTKQPDSAP